MPTTWLPTFVTGADVADAKLRLDSYFGGMASAMHACAHAPASSVAAWDAFYAGWRQFAAEDENEAAHWLAAGGRMDRVEQYGRDLQGWEAELAQWNCQQLAPHVVPSEHTHADRQTEQFFDQLTTRFAVLGGLALVAYAVLTYLQHKK